MVEVTLHAQLRWLERVEELPVAELRRAFRKEMPDAPMSAVDGAVLHELLRRTGRTNLDLISTILTPERRAAIRCGASKVKLPCGCVIRVADNRICTVVLPAKKFIPADLKRRRKRKSRRTRRNGYA